MSTEKHDQTPAATEGCAAAAGYVGTIRQETAEEREARIYADVFNPNESDYDYFLRRKRELGL